MLVKYMIGYNSQQQKIAQAIWCELAHSGVYRGERKLA
jgi:hypothetical protein